MAATAAPQVSRRLPLYHRPGRVVFVDDDADFLECIRMAMPKRWGMQTFSSPFEALELLLREQAMWEDDFRAQQRIITQWHGQIALIPQVLRYWASRPERFMAKVCVCDYSMPGMDGIELLSRAIDWHGHRVLVSATEEISNGAFNAGLIQGALPKQDPQLHARLVDMIDLLIRKPNERYHQIWSATLTMEQLRLLQLPSIASDLQERMARSWVEWVILGEPFGVLGLDQTGQASWLQLEPASELAQLAEMAAECGAPASDQNDILSGRSLSDVELQQALGARWPVSTVSSFAVGAEGSLYGALHKLPTSSLGEAMMRMGHPSSQDVHTNSH